MQNITKNLSSLERVDGNLSVTEFIIGFRFYIIVDKDGVKITQDEDYNQKTFGKIIDLSPREEGLPEFWNAIYKNYGVNEDRLKYAPIRYYTLHCIFYDPTVMGSFDTKYRDRGVVVVDIAPQGGTLVPQDKMSEFCSNLGLPAISPLFIGNSNSLENAIQGLRSKTNFSVNQVAPGIVIRKNNGEVDPLTLKTDRWYVDPNNENLTVKDSTPESMAEEFVKVTFSPEAIFNLSEKTQIEVHGQAQKFKNAMLKEMKKEFPDQYKDYMSRCSHAIGENKEKEFDKFLRKEISNYYNIIVKSLVKK